MILGIFLVEIFFFRLWIDICFWNRGFIMVEFIGRSFGILIFYVAGFLLKLFCSFLVFFGKCWVFYLLLYLLLFSLVFLGIFRFM